jgi:hypothetical protein
MSQLTLVCPRECGDDMFVECIDMPYLPRVGDELDVWDFLYEEGEKTEDPADDAFWEKVHGKSFRVSKVTHGVHRHVTVADLGMSPAAAKEAEGYASVSTHTIVYLVLLV